MFIEIHKSVFSELPFGLASIGESPQQVSVYRPMGHPFHQLIWVKGGSGIFTVDGETFVLRSGEGAFMRAGVPQSYSGNSLHTMWLTFSLSDRALDYIGIPRGMKFTVPHYFQREVDQLLTFANGESTPLTRSSAGYSLVTELFSSILPRSESVGSRVLRLLEQRYSEPLSLLSIAEAVHVNRFTLCRQYKEERGKTIMEELLAIRIAKAKRFLRYGSQPIEEVAQMCGFDSPSYFAKRFKALVGSSPAEYRRGLGVREGS